MAELLTKAEQARLKKYQAIATRLRALRMEFPNASKNRLYGALADEFGMTTMGIKNIVTNQIEGGMNNV